MSDENKDEILSNFQACTGVDDVAEALMWLEEAGWDLLTAIKNALPQDSQTLPSDYAMSNSHERTSSFQNMTNGSTVPVTISSDFIDDATTSDTGGLLPLKVHFCDRIINLKIMERMKLSDFKTLLYARTGVPTCSQIITGWDIDLMSDEDEIRITNYPSDGKLQLINSQSPGAHKITPRLYTLQIIDEAKSKDYHLELPASRTIRQVKNDVYIITDIEEQNQLWNGWPPNVTDSTKLCDAGLTLPVHTLSVRSKKDKKPVFIDLMDSEDSSPEEYEDASETFTVEDEMFVDEMPRRVEPLIPDDVDDEATGAVHFSDAFSRRYGDSHPEFFPGTLEDAIKEACMKPAKERKLLALYLHHDRSVLANVFCTELLCFESVLQTLAAYFVIWGWDITNDANKNKFLASVTQSLGIAVAETISSIQMDNLPALIIITRSRSNTELFTVINGNIGVSELLTLLIHAVDYYSDLQKEEMKEEEERTKRELIKIEQDQAFQQSLLLDRAKEEAKRQQEIMASKERERLAKEKQEMETKRQAERLAIQSKLPEEPEESCGSNTIKIRFRCPGQKILERRFLESQNLELLFNYLTVEGYRTDEYKVILSWPRRDLTTLNPKATFTELKLHAQETVTLEER